MTTYRTGNAIGSADPRDLYDNSENLDEFVNSKEKTTHPDRLGVQRQTWHGMEREHDAAQSSRDDQFQSAQSSREAVFSDFLQASGYQDLGEYAPGIEITAHNQYVTFGGQPYLLKPSIPVPYTTSGEWTGEDFKLIGDDSLRQDLANPDKGAAMVARGVVAVESIAELLALPEGQRKEGLRYLVKGYHAGSDIGGGEFYWTESEAINPDGGITHAAAGGGFVYRGGQTVTPFNFGAREGEESQEERIEAFFAGVHATSGAYTFSARGSFNIGRAVEVPFCQNKVFLPDELILSPNPSNTGLIPYALRLGVCDNTQFGKFRIRGTATDNTFGVGVLGTYIRQSQILKVWTANCRSIGFAVTSEEEYSVVPGYNNNNTLTVVEQRHVLCGTRIQGRSFSEIERTAGIVATSDQSVISVDLPELDDLPYLQYGIPVKIGTDYFIIKTYDRIAKTARLLPSLAVISPEIIASGSIDVFFGGGFLLRGADAGQCRTQQINVRNSTVALLMQAAYGSTLTGLTSQFNDIGLLNGRYNDSFTAGYVVESPYFEGEAELGLLTISVNASLSIRDIATELDRQYQLIPSGLSVDRRSSAQSNVRVSGQISDFATRFGGGVPRVQSYRRNSRADGAGENLVNIMAMPGGVTILSPDNPVRGFTFNLGVKNENTMAYCASGFALIVIGFSATNSITLRAPTGDTVEGRDSVVMSELPRNFWIACGRATPTNWEVHLVEMTSACSYIQP